jgi:predicted transcriptional regulator
LTGGTVVPEPKLGQEEWDILRYVADHAPIAVRDVADHFAATKGLARTTVITVMERLRAKRYLRRRKNGGVYRYSPHTPPAELAKNAVAQFVEMRLRGVIAPFVAYLSDAANISDDELRELKDVVRELEQKRREEAS